MILKIISGLDIDCKLGISSSNIIAYADGLVVQKPPATGLQKLIDKTYIEALVINLQFDY